MARLAGDGWIDGPMMFSKAVNELEDPIATVLRIDRMLIDFLRFLFLWLQGIPLRKGLTLDLTGSWV